MKALIINIRQRIKEKILLTESNYTMRLDSVQRFEYYNMTDEQKYRELKFFYITRFFTRGRF
jgi:hypothetical protein